ncbi:MAG: cysteine synthase family protein [Flavobacteriaceae bacterium]|nr:cysteine synthase family protein [Bacteroidia bacterium]MBT8378452.1 cysteine synthase family protein [Ignavibacteria bacterium]NNF85613.1 cysteine synthase family protein [Winogradskyella sp.]NNL16695.1 cysteine synthase family protein [Flavobacteriaceae bacterium]
MKAISKTPLVKLERIAEPNSAEIFVKLESANRTGSMKDRMALSMIEGAENLGELQPGGTVIEYTGGSTGSSLAMICSIKGYKAHLISSDAFSEEKIKMMRAFGAKVEIIPSKDGSITVELIKNMEQRTRELNENDNTFWIDQFNNVDNSKGYHGMAYEILSDLDNQFDEFIAGVGTGGCFSGNSEIFKKEIPSIKCIATEPYYVRALSGGDMSGGHKLEGMGIGFVPSICRLDLADKIIAVKDEDAYNMCRELAAKEGIFGGASSGANVWAAIQRARVIGHGKKIVTVICDSGLKYLKGNLYK